MSSNFVNLFNQITMLVNTSVRFNPNQNGGARNLNSASIFMAQGSVNVQNNILPQVELTNANQVQQNRLINQQLQESILQTQEALKEFTQADKSALIKNMLDLPDDLTQLLKNLVNKNETLTNSEFLKLLSMLNVNGKEAAAKLSKLMVFLGANNIKGAEKLQEVYSIVNALASGATQNASQLMKNIILLYLPWLPIGENNNFEIGLNEPEKKGNSSDEDGDTAASDSICIFIQTVNFSNIKVTLFKGSGNQINMFIDCVEFFPKEKLNELIKGESARLSVDTQMSFVPTKSSAIQKNNDTDFSVNVSSSISPQLMIMAQAVIKAVISIDKSTSLVDKRSRALN